MTFVFPKGEARFRNKQSDWDTDDFRLLLVMANSTAPTSFSAEFVADIATLDECNGAGYARTAIAGRTISTDTVNKIVSLLATQTDMPATGAGSRKNIAAIIYQHVGADAANPVFAYLDDALWFPFDAVGTPIRFAWSALGIVRYPLTPV